MIEVGGKWTKIKDHDCSRPNAEEAIRVLPRGSEWTCECGKLYMLITKQGKPVMISIPHYDHGKE